MERIDILHSKVKEMERFHQELDTQEAARKKGELVA